MKLKLKIKLNKKIVIIGLVVVAILGIGGYSYAKGKKAKVKTVTTTKVVKKKLTQTATATGNVEANYRNDISLNPAQKVAKVFVEEGQQVKKGDILAELDTTDYKNQLEKQRINLKNAEITLNQLQGNSVVNARESAENAVSEAAITIENAKNNYDDLSKKLTQNQSLYEGGYISQNDYDASVKAVTDAENQIRTAEISLSKAQTAYSNVDITNDDKVVNQRNQIALIKSDIDNANDKIEQCNLRANVDGKVVKVDAKEDQFPKAGDMLVVDDTSKYKISVDINQYDAVKIKKDQKVNIKVKGSTKKYTGIVNEVAQSAQAKVDTKGGGTDQEYKVNVKVIMDNPDEDIKAGYEADVEVILDEKPSILSIGFDAIKEDKAAGKKYVYVVDSKNKISKKYIKTGLETEYDVEVTSGLKEGDKYIVNPADTLKEGDLVADAGASKTGGSKK